MTFKFSPFLFGLALLGGTCGVLQMVLGDSSIIVRGIIWVVLLVSIVWVVRLFAQAAQTGVAAVPVFVWYLNIDRRRSSLLYFWAVLAYCAGLLGGLAMAAALAAQAVKSL